MSDAPVDKFVAAAIEILAWVIVVCVFILIGIGCYKLFGGPSA